MDLFTDSLANKDDWHDNFDDIKLPNAGLWFFPQLFSVNESTRLFESLLAEVNWQQEKIIMHGKSMQVPRLSAWYGDQGVSYTYSGILHHPNSWIEPLQFIKQRVETVTQANFNSVLCNLYRDGKDSVAWHSDDETELGRNPVIASVSLGMVRRFELRTKANHAEKYRLDLDNGSCLIMFVERGT